MKSEVVLQMAELIKKRDSLLSEKEHVFLERFATISEEDLCPDRYSYKYEDGSRPRSMSERKVKVQIKDHGSFNVDKSLIALYFMCEIETKLDEVEEKLDENEIEYEPRPNLIQSHNLRPSWYNSESLSLMQELLEKL